MYIVLIWIGLSVPMAFMVGRLLRGSSAPVPSCPAAAGAESVASKRLPAMAGAAMASGAADLAAGNPGD